MIRDLILKAAKVNLVVRDCVFMLRDGRPDRAQGSRLLKNVSLIYNSTQGIRFLDLLSLFSQSLLSLFEIEMLNREDTLSKQKVKINGDSDKK